MPPSDLSPDAREAEEVGRENDDRGVLPASDWVGVGKSQDEPRGEEAIPRLTRFRMSG